MPLHLTLPVPVYTSDATAIADTGLAINAQYLLDNGISHEWRIKLLRAIAAIASPSSFVANVLTTGSNSRPTTNELLTLVRWTFTFTDPGFPNDGRVIVVEAVTPASPASAVAVISDTGGSPATRLTTGQITGNASSWQFTAGPANDIVLTGGGSLTLDLRVEDTIAASSDLNDYL